MLCLGSKFGSSGLSVDKDWVKGSVPNAKVDTAEMRRRALEARLSSFSFCRSARDIPSILSGITDRDSVVDGAVSETVDVENDAAELNVSERISGIEVTAVAVIVVPCCPDVV